jgi:site-specific recombinase XerD
LTAGYLSSSLKPIVMGAINYIAKGKAQSTVKAYARDWRDFASWCSRCGLRALPASPSTIALYISDLAEFVRLSTIARRLAAISEGHAVEHYASPCSLRHTAVAQALAHVKHSQGTLSASKNPRMVDDLRRMILALPKNKLGARDAALLSIGFATGLKSLELATLNVEDIEESPDGLGVTLWRRKGDQASVGRTIIIRNGDSTACPVWHYRHWIEVSGITYGAVFRPVNRHANIGDKAITPQVVALAIKRACAHVGLDPARFGVTSLRSGWRLSREERGLGIKESGGSWYGTFSEC